MAKFEVVHREDLRLERCQDRADTSLPFEALAVVRRIEASAVFAVEPQDQGRDEREERKKGPAPETARGEHQRDRRQEESREEPRSDPLVEELASCARTMYPLSAAAI